MNKNLYRTVFSKAFGMLVPVAETARAHGKGDGRTRGASPAGASVALSAIASAVAAVLWSVPALATPPTPPTLPTGGTITGGAGTITRNGTTLTINQASDKLTAQWQGFDIGAGYGVVFNQPGRSSVALNRVIGPDASRIYGSLTANGHVFLVNPNGVLFAPGAQVNVGGLAASTLDISDQDFASGRYRFTRGAGAGSVVNEGQITAGSVVLIAPKVVNSGTISTPGGRTTLAAGDQVTVSMLDGLLTAQVDASVANAEIQNHGRILADGGRVDLIAGRADTVLNSLINVDGVIQARALREDGGRIFLDGGAGGTVTVSGKLDASAPDAARGGEVRVLGDQVTLAGGAHVDVSGQQTGGTALIGGDFQGKNAAVLNASRTVVEEGATIQADGAEQGGRVIVWADDTTRYAGSILARGKGFAEVSGKGTLQFSGAVDTGGGTLLLDPTNITIQAAAGDGTNTLSSAQLATLLTGSDVVLNADNEIAWLLGVTLDYNSVGTRSLTLQAGNIINFRGTITDSVAGGDRLNVTFNANRNNGSSGFIAINNGTIETNGGNIVLRGGSVPLEALPAFTDPGYETKLRESAARNVTINNSTLDAAGGNIVMRGVGQDGGTSVGVGLFQSTVQTSGAGTIAMDGIGGVGSGTNRGLQLINSTISAGDGSITLQGQGRGANNENTGIRVNGTTIEVADNGNLLVNALGGTGANFNDGIVLDASSRLSVTNGNMTVTGTGRGTGLGSDGIELASSSIMEATGTGSVTLNGTSTATGANTNRGVAVWIGSTARTTSGALTLQGASSDPAKGAAISLEGVTVGGAGQTGAITLQTGGSVLVASSTIDTAGALSITGGSYTSTGASTLKSNTLAFGNSNAIGGSGTLTFNQATDTTLANAIGGTIGVVKAGANTLTLTGTNTYTGATTINGGTLRIGGSGSLGSGAYAGAITNNGTLQYSSSANQTLSGGMSGSGGVAKDTAASTLTLSGVNTTYTGATTVTAGTLALRNVAGSDGASGYRSATTVNTGATLELAGNTNAEHTTGFALTLNNGSTLEKTNTGYDNLGRADVTINGTVAINVANATGGDLYIGNNAVGLQGSGTINVTSTGSSARGLIFRGAGGAGFSGTMNVSGSTVNLGSFGGSIPGLALQNTDLNLTNGSRLNLAGAAFAGARNASVRSLSGDGGSTVTLGGQTLTVGTNNGTGGDFGGVISGTGPVVKTGTGTQILSGNNTYGGTTTISGGTLQIGNGGPTGTLGTGAVTNNSSLVFNRSNSYTVPNLISGSGSVTQAGAGTTVLTANNTYTGTTTVSAGTLQVGNDGTTGTLGTGAVTNNGNLVFNRSDSTSMGALAAGGITGTGNVTALIGGALNVDRSIALTGANSAILLEAGKNQPAGTATGGDVTLTSNISTSAGGTITIFSGNATTAAYEAMVGGASGATRYKTYNANAAATGGAVAGTRNYYYRQAPTALSVSGLGASKVYDGLRDVATVDTTAAVVNGLIDGDTLAAGALNATGGRFDSAHAGARTLNATVSSATGPSYSGGGATWSVSGYSTANMAGSGTGTITPKTVTTTINAVGKTYDGQTGTTSTLGALTGFVGGDTATGVSGLQLAFDDPNAGLRNVVANGTGTLAGFTGTASGNGSGIGAGNEVAGLASDYAFVAPTPAPAMISPASLTVRANNDAKIVTQGDLAGYNGVSFSGFVNGETVANLGGALAITRTNAGTEAAGDYAGVLLPGGYVTGNYVINYVPGDYRILPAQQLLVRIQNVTNSYGTTTGYTVTSAQYLDADGVTFHNLTQTANSGNTYTYSDGVGGSVTFTVTPQGAVTSGAGHLAAGNYGLAGSSVTVGGTNFTGLHYVGNQTVNRAALNALPGGVSKVYDGDTSMSGLTLGLGGLLAGDAVNASGTGAFASRNAGTNLTYYVNGLALAGADAANYYLASGSSLTGTDGTITPRAITVTAVPATKVYDGTTAASGTPLVNGSLVGGDSFTLLGQQFASPNVGTNIRLIPTALIEDGNGGANYLLTFVESPLGQILAAQGPQPQPPQPGPAADPSVPSQAPTAAALHRGDDSVADARSRQDREAQEELQRRQVRVISTGLRLPAGLGASPLDDFERALK